jgi:hypothetical protein
MIANEVLQVPRFTYEHYLKHDPNSRLAQSEFEEFVKNLSSLRLLIFYALLKDSQNKGQLKFKLDDFVKTFIQALQLAYQDNDFGQDEAQRLVAAFSHELDGYTSYLETIPENDLRKDGFTAYACLYFTSKFSEPSKEDVKNGIYVSLINTQRLLMKEYYSQAIQKVKIT